MDPALIRERELFKKQALNTPVVEKRKRDEAGSSDAKKGKPAPSSSSGSKSSLSLARTAIANYRHIATGSSSKLSVLTKIVKHLRQKFLDGEDHPLTLDEILDETSQLDVEAKTRMWLQTEALPNNPKIEATYDKYQFRPPLRCRDKKSLLRLLKQYDLKGTGGIMRDDVLESVPNAERVLKSLDSEIITIGRQDKRKVLFYNDKHSAIQVDDEFQKLWRGVAVDGIDDAKIEDYLEKQGIKSMQDQTGKKPVAKRKPNRGNRKMNREKKLKDNEHMQEILKDYQDA